MNHYLLKFMNFLWIFSNGIRCEDTTGFIFSTKQTSTAMYRDVIVNITLEFKINSTFPLQQENITDDNSLKNVQEFTKKLFSNNSNIINVTTTHVQVTKNIITENQFVMYNDSCDKICIINTTQFPSDLSGSFELSTKNGTTNKIQLISKPTLYETIITTNPPQTYPTGESYPGKSAQLGIGLGITFIAIVIIIETIFFHRKYGCYDPIHQSNYGNSRQYYTS